MGVDIPAPEVKIMKQPKDLDLTYGYTDQYTLSVLVEEMEGYDLTYQWLTCRDGNTQDSRQMPDFLLPAQLHIILRTFKS